MHIHNVNAAYSFYMKQTPINKSLSNFEFRYGRLNEFNNLIGTNSLKEFVDFLAPRLDNSKSPILITGETGTGKSLLAKYLVSRLQFYQHPCKIISLSEIPESLFESQLFGHKKGAFTGANGEFIGKIYAANGGTLILEDINSLPLHLQSKILRVIQEGFFERIGETESIQVNLRVIATSNESLIELVKKNKFRMDLYYRLRTLEINIPPLRERLEEIEELCEYFLKKYCGQMNKDIRYIRQDCIKMLKKYKWYGNIRELESAIERAIIFCQPGNYYLDTEDFSKEIRDNAHPFSDFIENNAVIEDVRSITKEELLKYLSKNNYNKARTAQDLKISRRTLYNKLIKYDLI